MTYWRLPGTATWSAGWPARSRRCFARPSRASLTSRCRCVCVCVCAYIHISDVQLQATHALSLVVAEHAHNCDRLAALDDPPALAALVALVAAAGHKAASGACRVLANLCDVYGGSVLAALKVPWTRWTYVDVYDVHIV